MAYIAPGSIIKIRGKIGNKIYKLINGKIFITNAPVKVNSPETAESTAKKERFSVTQKIITAIKKLPALHIVWKNFAKVKNVHRYIFKQIWGGLNGLEAANISLLPGSFFKTSVISFSFTGGKVEVNFEPLESSSGVWPPVDIQLNMYGVVYSKNDGLPIKEKFFCIPVSSLDIMTQLQAPLVFSFLLSPVHLEFIEKSTSTELVAVLVTCDSKGMPTKYSNTVYIKLK